jgi:hypothetical protein
LLAGGLLCIAPERQQIKKIALSRPADRDLPFSTWSLAKLADFLVAEGVVEDISHEGLRAVRRWPALPLRADALRAGRRGLPAQRHGDDQEDVGSRRPSQRAQRVATPA